MIRIATPEDAPAIAVIFHNTVRQVNSRDYTPAQVAAWAGAAPDPAKWLARQTGRKTFVCEVSGEILGFAEFQPNGHIDAVYVHAEHQGEGIASALIARVGGEAVALGLDHVFTEASVTAMPFFQRRGFTVIEVQEVEYQSARFKNYRMKKDLA